MNNIFLIISVIISFVSPIIGIIGILRGNFRPQRMTRVLIMITTSIFVGTLFLQNDRNGLFLAVAQWVVAFSIFILSIKYGIGGKTKLDILVFILAIITIIIWKITQNNILALGLSILVDLISFVPTLIKAYKSPETEDWKFYLSDTLAGLFSILSISLYTFANILFPMYILLINGALVGIILVKSSIKIQSPSN